jgi:hypothetical protein
MFVFATKNLMNAATYGRAVLGVVRDLVGAHLVFTDAVTATACDRRLVLVDQVHVFETCSQ